MPDRCCVPNCRGNYDNGPKVSAFSFPKDPDLQKKWLNVIKRENFKLTKHSRVCELHFSKEQIIRKDSYHNPQTGKLIEKVLQKPRLAPGIADMDRFKIPDHLRREPPENWRKELPNLLKNWRINDHGPGRENERLIIGNSRSAISFQYRRNNANRNAVNNTEITDEEFINQLRNNGDTEHVTSLLMSTQRFVKIVNTQQLSDDVLVKLLNLVSRLCESTNATNKNYLVKVTMQQKFVKTVNSFLSLLVVNNDKLPEFWETFDKTLQDLVTILDHAINLMPMTMWEPVKSVLKSLKVVLPALKNDNKFNVSTVVEQKLTSLQNDIVKIENMFNNSENEKGENTHDLEEHEKDPENNYRIIDIYPNITELIIPDRPYLRKNIVDRPFASVGQYLDIHFRLLREDFMNSIRQDLCDYLNKSNRRLFNIKIHENVKFTKHVLYKDLNCFKIQFNVPKWISESLKKGDQLKRLIHGTLLLFSSDHFNTMFSGKVINSDDLKNGCILVEILGRHSITPTFGKNYLMVECVVFFEPYLQILSVLKYLDGRSLPMEDYIIKISTETKPPKYIANFEIPNNVPGLNCSQEIALNAAMSKEFVIIQGPPGTGKTFLGMKIVNQILKLKQYWRRQGPILVICFTNHALDQFLQGLRKQTNKIARLGGRNNLRSVEWEFGPEAEVRDVIDMMQCYSEESERFDTYADTYNTVIRALKSGSYIHGNISRECESYISKVSDKTKDWMLKKGQLNRRFYQLKQMEKMVIKYQIFIDNFGSLKTFGILKTKWVFQGTWMYYYFTDFELACWLLCDDGTIKSDLNTMQNMELAQTCDDPYQIYNLLSDCLIERNLLDEEKDFGLTIEILKNFAYEVEQYLKEYPYDRNVQDYLKTIRRKTDYLRFCLNTEFDRPEVDLNNINPWNLSSKQRWQLYNQWVEDSKTVMDNELNLMMANYREDYNAYELLREEDNVKLLRKMNIVGMTTTCAARLRSTLEKLKNPIVVVEEAAEVLESHIVTALTRNCQHLILLGDHKQLRPSTSDYTIEKKYKLGISLFERMVNNNVQCHTLNVQHRMRPEISQLLKPLFYKDLEDSDSVKKYPTVTGVKCPLFFIDHTESEEPYGDSSKMNIHESKFLIQLAIYLLNNDYQPDEITILAAYLGQTYMLKEERKKSSHPLIHKVHITAVDNFQGEENKIILLSLVRNNIDNKIGFLSVDNRVCVALSRAKEGFYIMGNMRQLCTSSEIWKPIKASLESQKAIGRYLPLCCRHHSEYVTLASKPSDFRRVPEGGCDLACDAELECGHRCIRKCHGYDIDHKQYQCMDLCKESLCDVPEHKCQKLCHERCGSCYYPVVKRLGCGHEKSTECSTELLDIVCTVLVEVKLDDCEHIQQVPCYQRLADLDCEVPVEKELPCGHKERVPCNTHTDNYECKVLVQVKHDVCEHIQKVPCYKKLADLDCEVPVEKELPCGHKVIVPCNIDTADYKCTHKVELDLPCGHKVFKQCHQKDPEHKTYKCLEPCSKKKLGCHDPDNHPKCNLRCGENCQPCTVILMVTEKCPHFNRVACHKKETTVCNKKCNRKLSCGHICVNKCCDRCSTTCEQKTFKIIPECGHRIKVQCKETPAHSLCKEPCPKTLSCGHGCKNFCRDECTQNCTKRCNKILECGHACIKLCHEPCACKIEKYPDCDHSASIKCEDILRKEDCKEKCRRIFKCGHRCKKLCGEDCECLVCKEVRG